MVWSLVFGHTVQFYQKLDILLYFHGFDRRALLFLEFCFLSMFGRLETLCCEMVFRETLYRELAELLLPYILYIQGG